ncbi:MAG: hypothetical protein ACXVZ1_11815, partial [Gaiellaceae bacterium]
VSTDLPLAIPAVGLGLYAARRAPRLPRLSAFGGGGALGLVPLLAFDWWAFGSPFHLPYSGAAVNPGAGGVEQTPGAQGFFTLHVPSFRIGVELLLSQRGLLVLTPVVVAAVAGLVLLWRRGLRAEVALVAGLSVAELAWNAGRDGTYLALGGWVPGPRFLIPLLPFLCFAIAPVLRRAPATVGVLALVSAAAMVVATSAEPLLQNDDTRHWLSRIGHGNFTATVLSLGGIGHGWLAILPFLALVLMSAGAAIAATRLPLVRHDLATAGAALLAWAVVEHAAPELLRIDRAAHGSTGLLAALLLVGAAAWAALRLRPQGLLLLPFATVCFDGHTKWALALSVAAVGALALGRIRLPQARSA